MRSAKCTIVEKNGIYKFNYRGESVLAPNGKPAEVDDKRLAEAIKRHIDTHGPEMTGASDILAWHYTYQCNFKPMGQARVVEMLKECFLRKSKDITFVLGAKIKKIADIFGTEKKTVPEVEKWLEGLSTRQLTAACCIGNAYHSINLARLIAAGMADGWCKISKESFADMVSSVFQFEPGEILSDIELFELYYQLPDVDVNAGLANSVPWKDSAGKYRCAGDACPPGLCESGKCPLDICTKAIYRMQAGDYRGAIPLFEKGLSLASDYANGWTNLAACYGNLGNHRKALECAKKALAADPDYAPAKQIVAVASRNI